MSFADAMRISRKMGEIRAYGVEGAQRREEEKRRRLEELRENAQRHKS